jgi:L-asparagine transporter-like permease
MTMKGRMTMDATPDGALASPSHGLGQSLRSRHVTMITVGGIIGAGLFVGSSASIASIGPACVVSYALAGLVILLIMRMLSELAAAAPGVGSFTEYTRLGLGDWAGFTSGWLYWYFWVAVVPIEAIGGANILQTWLPGAPIWLLGLVLLTAMTAVNLLSARSFGEFEFWFSSIKVAAIIVFIVIAAGYACGLGAPLHESAINLTGRGGFAPHGRLAILSGIATVIFSFVGAEIVTIAAAEARESARIIARLTSTVAIRILLFFVVSIFLIVCIVPWDTIRPGTSPFAVALAHIGIPGAAGMMKLVVLTAVLSCLNSGIYVTSRVLFGLAARGEAPQALVTLTANRVPRRAILAGAAFGYLAMAASAIFPQGVFSFLVNTSGAIALVNYLLVALAEWRLRRRWERMAPSRLVIKMWLFPYLTWVVMAVIVGVLAAMAITPDLRSQFTSSFAVVLLVLAAFGVVSRRTAQPVKK